MSFSKINSNIVKTLNDVNLDYIFISKGLFIAKKTIVYIKKKYPELKIIYFSNDNINLTHNTSISVRNYLKYIDLIVTMKIPSYRLSYKNVLYIDKSYSPVHHFPVDIEKKFDILFIGTYEKERYLSLLYISNKGLNVTVFGNDWNHVKSTSNLNIKYHSVIGKDYREYISSSYITLCFLRKKNKDTQTSRSFEIPACGGFILAERSGEHEMIFNENENAVFFSNNDELYKKCLYYLKFKTKNSKLRKNSLSHIRCYKNTYLAKLDYIFQYLNDI